MGLITGLLSCLFAIAAAADEGNRPGNANQEQNNREPKARMTPEEVEVMEQVHAANLQRQIERTRQLAYQIATGNVHPCAYGDHRMCNH
jgi:Coiled-coil domain-containing protein 56